jgi:hypothetical protein
MYPSFGGFIDKMITIGTSESNSYLAFATSERIVGIASLPLTGNPYKMMGLVAHPGAISSIAGTFSSDLRM